MRKMTGLINKCRVAACLTTALLLAGCIHTVSSVKPVPDTTDMVYVPEGWFSMGSREDDGIPGQSVGVDEIPQHRVYVNGFYMDLFEVTVGKYRMFLDITGRKAPRIWTVESYIDVYPEPEDTHPMKGVSWYDADSYCRWAGKRLPTEEEWEKAARGTDGRQWPWGNDFFGPDGKIMANTREARVGWTTQTGSYPEGVSPYGIYDMAGSVMEWTSSWYKPYPGSTLQREAFGEKYKVLRGGSWENPSVPFARSAYRHAVAPKWDHPAHGFRCAVDGP